MRLLFGIVPVVLFLALATNHCVRAGVQPEDAGYVALRIADNLRHGQGFAFNTGERRDLVESPLWVGMLSVLTFSSQASLLVQALGLLLGAAVLLAILGGARLPLTGACASLFLALDGLFAARSTSGSSSLLGALYLLGLYLLLRNARGRGEDAALAERNLALWASIAALVRYELAFVALPATLVWGLTDRRRWHAWMPFSMALGGNAIWFAVRWNYFSESPAYWEPWPPTAASVSAGAHALASLVLHRPLLLFGIAVLLSSFVRAPLRGERSAGLVWGLLGLIAFSLLPGRGSDVAREAAVVLPLAYLLVTEAVWRGARTRPGLAAALLLVVAQPAWTWVGSPSPDTDSGSVRLGQWLETHALPGTVVGARQVGALGYYSHLKTEDVVGRVSPRAAMARRLQPPSSFEAASADFGPMLRQEPDLVLVAAHEQVPPATLYVPNDEGVPAAIRGSFSVYRWAGSPVWRDPSPKDSNAAVGPPARTMAARSSAQGGVGEARPSR